MGTNLMQLISATLGSLGFSLIFNIRGRTLLFATLGGFLTWSVCLLLARVGFGDVERYLCASVTVSAYAEFAARRRKSPTTVFLVPGIILLVPGSRLYATMVYAVHLQGREFVAQGLNTLLLAGSIAAGIILVSTVMHAVDVVAHHRRKISG